MLGLQLKFLLRNQIVEHYRSSPFDDLVGELGRQVRYQLRELLLERGVEGRGRVVRCVIFSVLKALGEVAVARLERVDVLDEFSLGDTSSFYGLRPGSSWILLVDEPLQLLPELGAAHVPRDRDFHRL